MFLIKSFILIPAYAYLPIVIHREHEVELGHFLCQSGFDVRDARLRKKDRVTVCAIADHVDMGMMAFVVEGGVPAELVKRNPHSVRKPGSVTGKQVFPLPGVVVAQTGGVLPAQRNDGIHTLPEWAATVSATWESARGPSAPVNSPWAPKRFALGRLAM